MEHEAYFTVAEYGTLGFAHGAYGDAVQQILSYGGRIQQPSMFNSVDLPEPDVPMMVTNSPSPIENDTPRSACTVSSPTWKFRFMF